MTTASSVTSDREIALNYQAGAALEETRWFSLARISLIAMLFAAPLAFGAVQTWAWAALAVVSVLLLLFWAIGCVRQHEIRVHLTPLCLPVMLFLLLGIMQLLTGQTLDRIGTREALIKLTTDLLIFFLAGQLFAGASRRFWHKFGLAVTLYAFAMSIFAIFQFFSQPDLIYWAVKPRWGGAVFGPYVNHNHYAGLMEMLIPIAAAFLFAHTGRHPWRWLIGFGVALSFVSVVLSGSRGGLVALIFESAILAVVLLFTSRNFGKRSPAITVSLAMATAVGLFLWIAPPDVVARWQSLLRSQDLSYTDRRQMSFDSLRMLQGHPLMGTGLGSFETAYPRYQSLPIDLVVDHAHNDFAEALAETGLEGGLLIVLSLVLFFISAGRNLRVSGYDLKGWIGFGAVVGCCGVLLHSCADFNLHIPANACWFAFAASIAGLKVGGYQHVQVSG